MSLIYHELRNPEKHLIFRGSENDCYLTMVEITNGTITFGELLQGWTVLPYEIKAEQKK